MALHTGDIIITDRPTVPDVAGAVLCPTCGDPHGPGEDWCDCGEDLAAVRRLQAAVATGVVGRPFAIRGCAWLIDLGIVYGATMALGAVAAMLLLVLDSLLGKEPELALDEKSIWILGMSVALGLLYHTLFEGLHGATPGKLLLRMRVVRKDGRPCGLPAALVRGLLRYVDSLFFGFVAFANMKPPFQQRIGDKMAGTVVVDARAKTPVPGRDLWWFLAAAVLYLGTGVLLAAICLAGARL